MYKILYFLLLKACLLNGLLRQRCFAKTSLPYFYVFTNFYLRYLFYILYYFNKSFRHNKGVLNTNFKKENSPFLKISFISLKISLYFLVT